MKKQQQQKKNEASNTYAKQIATFIPFKNQTNTSKLPRKLNNWNTWKQMTAILFRQFL